MDLRWTRRGRVKKLDILKGRLQDINYLISMINLKFLSLLQITYAAQKNPTQSSLLRLFCTMI